MKRIDRIAAGFLTVSAACLVLGAWLLLPAAGVLTAGVCAAVAGVLALKEGPE